ncbi:hypothetical protein PDN20_29850, partial [Bacillus cereus]|nr:hypothetical protein [Bacillus cereus]MDA2130438.1 hypothetical protein [Bacillus cereus]MDA2152774.1 hypothetical protein [Bacillus cereus]
MKKVSGLFHIVDFKTEKIIAVLQPKDYYDDLRHWELKSNIDTLTFKVLIDNPNADALIQQNLILRQTRDGRFIPYVIEEAIQTKDGRFIEIFSSAVWVEIAQSGIIRPQRIEGKTVNEFINMALIGMKWKLGKTDYAGFHTMTIDEFIDPLTFLGKIASLFKLEIQYRVEVFANKIVNWYVDMIIKRGRYTGKEINLGKDLINVRRIENTRNICTALVGFVRGEGDSVITIESINNGLPYIVDNEAFQRWNVKGFHRFGFYTPETDNQNMTPQRLLTLMEMEMKKRKDSSVTYEVEAQDLSRVEGFEHEQVGEGDTIIIKDPGFKPKLYLEARAIAGDESFKDPTAEKYLFGNYREITDPNEEMRKLYNRLLGQLTGKANKELLDQLERLVEENGKTIETIREESKAVKELAEKVQENLKNNTVNIIESKQPPTENLQIGKTIWRDISNGKPGILKVWNGKGWELLIPDVESIKKDTLEQVNKDIKLTKEELNKKVEEAQEETTGQFNQVTESLQKVTRTISDVQRDQGEIDKKVTKFEQDSEGFKTSIETLTKNSTDTTSKINTLVNDVDGNKKVISEVKESVANFNDDVRNLLVGSKSFDGALTFAQADNRWWLKSADKVKISKDVFQGNAVIETQSSWTALAYNFKDLVDRKVVKVGDKVTYSIFTRVKGLSDGQDLQHTFYFAPGATGIRPNKSTNQWQRVSVSFTVTASMMSSPGTDNESHFRVEPDANPPAGCWYQQSSPQLIITVGNKEYSWRPAPEDIADGNVLTKVTTEIKEAAGKISEKLTSVETKVNNTKIGGRNVVLGTSIPASLIGNNTANQTTNIYNFVGGDSSSILNKEICVSFDWKVEGTTTPSGTMYMQGSNPYPLIVPKITFSPQNLSGKYMGVITISGSAFKAVNMRLDNFTTGAKIIVSNFQIEIGNKPQEWRPAPEDQVTTDEFTKKTTEIEKSVNGIKESIKTVEKTQVDFSERVTTVEKTADGIKEKVTSLQEVQTEQGTQLQEAKAGWETTAKALEGKVEIKDVEDYVGGIGNQTVLRNVLWKNDTKYWILQSGTTRDTTVLYKGCNTLRTISTGNTADVYRGATHEFINAGPGWNYVFSAYFYTDNKSSIDNGAKMELKCLDANGNVLKQYGQEITLTQGMWVRHHVFGLLVEGTKKVQVQYWLRKNGRLWAAQPMLQIGDKPSSFMENPVDIVDKDKIMEELADKIATEPYNKKVTELERGISATAEGVEITSKKQEKFINETYAAYVKETGSKLKVLDEGILAEVKKGNIIAAINFSSEKLEIDVSKVAINADTMVKWLTAKGIDTNLIRIDGDKITIDKDGVTVKMLDFLFQDEWGTKTTAVSRRNLIADPDFSSVTKKNIGHSDYYGFEGGYGLTWKSWGNVVIEKNTHIFDYEQMVNAARVDMYNYPEAIVNNG